MAHKICNRCNRCHTCTRRESECARLAHCTSSSAKTTCSYPTSSVLSTSTVSHDSSSHGYSYPKSYRKSHARRLPTREDLPLVPLEPEAFDYPEIRGSVFNAITLDGPNGTDVIIKWEKLHHHKTCGHDHLNATILSAQKAKEVVQAFQDRVNVHGWSIRVLQPKLIRTHRDATRVHGRRAISEMRLPNVQKFISNSGWSCDSDAVPVKLLASLSHFSYVWSKHQLLLCNLRGHIDYDLKVIFLTSPTILTRQGSVYGCSDIGLNGIQNFFYWHECNSACVRNKTSRHVEPYFKPTAKTLTLSVV